MAEKVNKTTVTLVLANMRKYCGKEDKLWLLRWNVIRFSSSHVGSSRGIDLESLPSNCLPLIKKGSQRQTQRKDPEPL